MTGAEGLGLSTALNSMAKDSTIPKKQKYSVTASETGPLEGKSVKVKASKHTQEQSTVN